MTPSNVFPMMASSEFSTMAARCWAASNASLCSVTSRTAAVTSSPSLVWKADRLMSTGNSVPSWRRPLNVSPAPIGRATGSEP